LKADLSASFKIKDLEMLPGPNVLIGGMNTLFLLTIPEFDYKRLFRKTIDGEQERVSTARRVTDFW